MLQLVEVCEEGAKLIANLKKYSKYNVHMIANLEGQLKLDDKHEHLRSITELFMYMELREHITTGCTCRQCTAACGAYECKCIMCV